MGSADWDDAAGSSGQVRRGVTYALGAPPSAGSVSFGAKSESSSPAAWAMHANQTEFDPVVPGKGSMVLGAIRAAHVSSAPRSCPLVFAALQPDPLPPPTPGPADIGSAAYLLGLSSSGRLTLVKGAPSDGIPDAVPGTMGVLRRSDQVFAPEAWLHVRLDVVVNATGDVVVRARRNDLAAHTLALPTWEEIPGMALVIDDRLGMNTGSRPFGVISGGYAGFGAHHPVIDSVATFGRVDVLRGA